MSAMSRHDLLLFAYKCLHWFKVGGTVTEASVSVDVNAKNIVKI